MCNCKHPCDKRCKCLCHDHAEREAGRMYAVGQSAGLDEAAHDLLTRATVSFAQGRDEEAKMLRGLAQDFKKRAKERHPGVPGP